MKQKTICVCGLVDNVLWGVRDESILVACDHCGVRRVVDIDPEAYLSQYISGRYHTNATTERSRMPDPPYRERFEEDWLYAMRRMDRLTEVTGLQGGLLVDVGCANGAFVHEARIRGWDAYGLDLSLEAAPEEVRPYLRYGTIENAPLEWLRKVDVITLHDVLEHCLDPMLTLQFIRAALKPGGMLVVDIPNHGCPEANLRGVEWGHVKPKEHLWYFTQKQLRAVLERAHFAVMRVEYPVADKMVFYAHSRLPQQEVRIYVPPGIGDIHWCLVKVQAIRALHEPCSVTVVVSTYSKQGLERRSEGWLALMPFVDKADYEHVPFDCDLGQMTPELPHYMLFPNNHLEQGHRIEDWRPEWETDLDYPLFAPTDAAEWARDIKNQAGGRLFTFYFSSCVFNEKSFQKNLWTVKEWVTVTEWARRAYGIKPVIVGSWWDRDYADKFFALVNPEHYIDLIGQTSVAQLLALDREAACVTGAACGATQTAHAIGSPTVAMWPVTGISQGTFQENFTRGFATSWTNPRYMPTYRPFVYGEAKPIDLIRAIRDVARIPATFPLVLIDEARL